jgi:hypothetical protein
MTPTPTGPESVQRSQRSCPQLPQSHGPHDPHQNRRRQPGRQACFSECKAQSPLRDLRCTTDQGNLQVAGGIGGAGEVAPAQSAPGAAAGAGEAHPCTLLKHTLPSRVQVALEANSPFEETSCAQDASAHCTFLGIFLRKDDAVAV